MSRLAIVVAIVIGTGGCTSFEPIDRGVCGNGLVEAGEDCDSNAESCVRCAVVCSEAKDCPTMDYACGADGFCHAPGGLLGPATPAGPFQVNDLAITDIDHDKIGDVVGVSRTSVAVRYGEPTGRLTRSDSVVTPSQLSAAAFGDLDADGSTDLTIATADGLVSYGSRFGGISPMPVGAGAVEGSADIDIRHAFHIGRLTLGAFLADLDGSLIIAAVDLIGTPTFAAPCFVRLGLLPVAQSFASSAVDVYQVSDTELVVSLLTTASPRKLCVMSLHKPLFAPWVITDITPANAGGPAGLTRKPILADLEADADRCPGLVNTDGGAPGLRYWDGAMAAGGCTLQAVASPQGTPLVGPPQRPTTIVPVGRIPLSPAFGFAAADLLVMSDGIYAYTPGVGSGFEQLYISQRRLAGANHADLDGDGRIDGVLIPESEDDLDVVYRRTNTIVPLFPAYVVLRLDTASRVTSTELADYDGNGRLDIAMVEQLTDHQRLSVAYGTTDLLLQPAQISAFPTTWSMASVGFGDSDDIAAVCDDLVVLQPPLAGTSSPVITILSGSVQRTMTPYFDPRGDDDPDMGGPLLAPKEISDLRGVMVGRFIRGDKHREPIAVMTDRRTPAQNSPLLWPTRGTSFGPDATPTPSVSTMGLADCAASIGTGLCVSDATFVPWPISETRDTVIAYDRAGTVHVVAFDPGATGTVVATEVTAVMSKLPLGTVIRAMHPADLDGDGTPELVVSAGARLSGEDAGGILVCDVDASGVPRSCEDLAPAIIAATQGTAQVATTCFDAAPARIALRDSMSASGGQDLVVACRDGGSSLYRVHRGEAELEISLLGRTQTRIGAVRTGDVTGDGVDDVIALEGESGARSLVVFTQCSSRNLAACARGGGS